MSADLQEQTSAFLRRCSDHQQTCWHGFVGRPERCISCVVEQAVKELAASEAARQQLLDTLTAARDLLVGCQKQAGYLPQQGGYATALTEAEMTLARGIASLDDILTGASR
jgi:hypothetical protein